MKRHVVKLWSEYYPSVRDGYKTFEVRVNDRDYQPGDEIVLHEFNRETKRYIGSGALFFRIGFVLPIDEKRVVFSLLPTVGNSSWNCMLDGCMELKEGEL